ncbi:uncharacterized protein LOC119373806 [Rhipicephalus sanguineus]|uniref:uncharacterized protein LOC119373806 n=1 Tax=Rhipicephalus sanguineus TaxID=34632 RepID=UPI0020C32C1E|nr:uncharacterized protein LOC119373806 [Rhipicephalus sanguineus]
MFRITVILLLCAAIVCTQMPDIFEGCVRYNRKHEEPQKCTFEPRSRIRGNASFEHIAHLVLKYGKIQPTSGQLNTLLRLTRVATEHYRTVKDFSVRLEFMTTLSSCNTWQIYNPQECLPLEGKVLCNMDVQYAALSARNHGHTPFAPPPRTLHLSPNGHELRLADLYLAARRFLRDFLVHSLTALGLPFVAVMVLDDAAALASLPVAAEEAASAQEVSTAAGSEDGSGDSEDKISKA